MTEGRTNDRGAATEVTLELADADATRDLGRRLSGLLRAGDLVVLTGDLGAGKTTMTQGLGAGLGVRGQVASPTFVVAREHPPLGDGPALVHVDAYRLGGLDDLDALDLDSSLDDAVTVVEWGEGLADVLSEDRLEISIARPRGGVVDASDADTDRLEAGVRRVVLRAVGPRWSGAHALAGLRALTR
ncbi:tRNA threonylcarbamoyladenosine biosynthesis protein TsaE [Paraoerskovia sediminicola]|uniref:tRNA threonylcarbamoyladenosine biosynthesis protein TsaE n=1 Tax=Paraoerskovia sediminicola TaxID=1138587 RepID=A0ABN6X8M9_9CELL|nr:tRNA (adenosine(37)-N6)-threonylcarbamoyltransferase complex ATPase subunit type 1 TsaE [Paraoerskovia sediminicola]BDZ41155.1 tRNA threonylcarbamoyladenosine biosynthesis protein TsaE [Paraoerskovia sediminicola]